MDVISILKSDYSYTCSFTYLYIYIYICIYIYIHIHIYAYISYDLKTKGVPGGQVVEVEGKVEARLQLPQLQRLLELALQHLCLFVFVCDCSCVCVCERERERVCV